MTHGLTQDEMLSRIRRSLGSSEGQIPSPPAINEGTVRRVSQGDDVVGVFATNAETSGMVVQRVRSEELESAVAACLNEVNARAVSIACDDAGFAQAVSSACKGGEIEIVEAAVGKGFDPHYGAQVGVTDVDAAIAETGSLVLSSTPGRGRGPALVPPVHVAIVPASRIVADLIDVWAAIGKERVVSGRAAVVLISGPSKTGDIEGVLVTGVHGPGEVRVLLVEDL